MAVAPCYHFQMGKPSAIPYSDKRATIRAALLKRAKDSAKTLTYEQFGKLVGVPTRGPWKPVLDLIAHEETDQGLPDITFLVVQKRTGYPGQIGFKRAVPPSADQKARAVAEMQKVIDRYNPGKPNPFRAVR